MNWKIAFKILLALVVFALLQNVFLIIFALAYGNLTDLTAFISLNPGKMGMSLILSGCVTSFLVCKMGMARWPQAFCWNGLKWQYALLGIGASLTAIFASNMLSEMLELPDLMQSQFEGMAKNLWGILALAIVGPVVEEIVFREGIQGFLTRKGTAPWHAMLSSALLFGVIHMNPAQIPFAFLIGLCLSIIYHKTQSIALTSFIHILNNASAVAQMNLLGERFKDARIADILRFDAAGMWVAILFLSATSIMMFRLFWNSEE